MICGSCGGYGKTLDRDCATCKGKGQYPSLLDQTFIVVKEIPGKEKFQVFAIQGDWRSELLETVKKNDEGKYGALLEQIRLQPNLKIEQARAELRRIFPKIIRVSS